VRRDVCERNLAVAAGRASDTGAVSPRMRPLWLKSCRPFGLTYVIKRPSTQMQYDDCNSEEKEPVKQHDVENVLFAAVLQTNA